MQSKSHTSSVESFPRLKSKFHWEGGRSKEVRSLKTKFSFQMSDSEVQEKKSRGRPKKAEGEKTASPAAKKTKVRLLRSILLYSSIVPQCIAIE